MCFSKRNAQKAGEKMVDRVAPLSRKLNLEGTPPYTHRNNSFAVLSDPEMMLRASKMGVCVPDDNFTTVDVLHELEKSRMISESSQGEGGQNVDDSTLFLTNGKGECTPLSTQWGDDCCHLEERFSVVRSKKARGKKKPVIISRPVTRSHVSSRGGSPCTRAQTQHLSAAPGKGNNRGKNKNK